MKPNLHSDTANHCTTQEIIKILRKLNVHYRFTKVFWIKKMREINSKQILKFCYRILVNKRYNVIGKHSENIWIEHWGKCSESLSAEILKSSEAWNESDIKYLWVVALSRFPLETLMTAQLSRNSKNSMEAEVRNYLLFRKIFNAFS
jgi:hypothetical protein